MNIGFVSTRLAGNDGVSLEAAKWAAVLRRMGHRIFYCAGELEDNAPPGKLIPEIHFNHPENMWIREHAYGTTATHPELRPRIERLQATIKPQLADFINDYAIDLIIPQNVLVKPIQFSLTLALTDIIAETGILTIAHHHDFYWERDDWAPNCVQDILDRVLPPDLPSITHVVINSVLQRDLKTRRGIDSVVVPNVFDFATPPSGVDEFNADFRTIIGLTEEDFYILSPVRIIHRKGLELAVELVGKLHDSRCKLVFTHGDDVDTGYLKQLQEQAHRENVDLRVVTDCISSNRRIENGKKVYSLWDAYVHADFVTYPSLYEGFGNALLEAIYFKKPTLVNRYPVYETDIGPLGFDLVEIDGRVTDETVTQVRDLLEDSRPGIVEHNYKLGQEYFSYTALEAKLRAILQKYE